jgi:hypothetical protein
MEGTDHNNIMENQDLYPLMKKFFDEQNINPLVGEFNITDYT